MNHWFATHLFRRVQRLSGDEQVVGDDGSVSGRLVISTRRVERRMGVKTIGGLTHRSGHSGPHGTGDERGLGNQAFQQRLHHVGGEGVGTDATRSGDV